MKENDNLPSVRTLSKELRISALTAKKAYDALEKYMGTDLTPRMMSRIAVNLTKYEEKESPILTGKNKMGEFGFIEYRLDQQSLDKAVRELFYDEVK